MVNKREILKAVGALPLAWCCTQPVAGYAQSRGYPSKPITLIVPFGPGNASDTIARMLAQRLGGLLGQQVIVENRPGAGGVNAIKLLSRADPDGYTLLLLGAGTPISQSLLKPAPYNILRDTVQVATLTADNVLILVPSGSRFKNLADFIREAKERGAAMTVGINTLGTLQHMSAELFKSRAKLDYLVVPFGTASGLLNALAAGNVDVAFEYASPTLSLITSGKLRALATCSAKRLDLLPDVPTATELGIPNFNIASWSMIVAPAQTPDPIVQRLNQEIQRVLATPAFVNRLRAIGLGVLGGTSLQAHDLMVSEVKRWGDVISTLKIELK